MFRPIIRPKPFFGRFGLCLLNITLLVGKSVRGRFWTIVCDKMAPKILKKLALNGTTLFFWHGTFLTSFFRPGFDMAPKGLPTSFLDPFLEQSFL